MIDSKVLNNISISCYHKIITEFKPTMDVKISSFVDEILLEKHINLEEIEYKKLFKKIKNKLKRYLDLRKEKKSIGKFNFSNADDDFLVGVAKKSPKYSSFPDYHRFISRLSDNAFELFSGAYMNLIFTNSAFVTRKSMDGGIDFIGKGFFTKKFDLNIETILENKRNIFFRIVGQSKRYDSSKILVGLKEMREFFGSVKILQNALDPNYLNAWKGEILLLKEIRLADPFLLIFLTSTYYTNEAIDLANKLGIILLDIDDLIFDLIDKGIGLDENQESGFSLNSVKINKWIKMYESSFS